MKIGPRSPAVEPRVSPIKTVMRIKTVMEFGIPGIKTVMGNLITVFVNSLYAFTCHNLHIVPRAHECIVDRLQHQPYTAAERCAVSCSGALLAACQLHRVVVDGKAPRAPALERGA